MEWSSRAVLSYSTNLSPFFFTLQCLGSPTQSVWPTSAPCGVMLPCSSASSPPPSRSTSVWCPGRKTLFPSSPVGHSVTGDTSTAQNKTLTLTSWQFDMSEDSQLYRSGYHRFQFFRTTGLLRFT